MIHLFHAAKLMVVGGLFIFLGVSFWNTPTFRDDPDNVTPRDLLTCGGPVLAGVLMVLFGVFQLFRRRK